MPIRKRELEPPPDGFLRIFDSGIPSVEETVLLLFNVSFSLPETSRAPVLKVA